MRAQSALVTLLLAGTSWADALTARHRLTGPATTSLKDGGMASGAGALLGVGGRIAHSVRSEDSDP